jgi:hypothetical protein
MINIRLRKVKYIKKSPLVKELFFDGGDFLLPVAGERNIDDGIFL